MHNDLRASLVDIFIVAPGGMGEREISRENPSKRADNDHLKGQFIPCNALNINIIYILDSITLIFYAYSVLNKYSWAVKPKT